MFNEEISLITVRFSFKNEARKMFHDERNALVDEFETRLDSLRWDFPYECGGHRFWAHFKYDMRNRMESIFHTTIVLSFHIYDVTSIPFGVSDADPIFIAENDLVREREFFCGFELLRRIRNTVYQMSKSNPLVKSSAIMIPKKECDWPGFKIACDSVWDTEGNKTSRFFIVENDLTLEREFFCEFQLLRKIQNTASDAAPITDKEVEDEKV